MRRHLVIGLAVLSIAYVAIVVRLERKDRNPADSSLPLPRLDGRVVGRTAMVESLAELLLKHEPGTVIALHGAGGFGKTTLALLAAGHRRVARHFRGGIFWVSLGQDCRAAELAARLNDVTEQLTGARPELSDPLHAGLRLGQALDRRKRSLLILDDVWTSEQLEPFIVGGDHCARLVTTRVPTVLPANAHQFRVDAMEATDARNLLTWRCPLAQSDVDAIVALSGAWPLLLALLNSGLRRSVAGGLPPSTAVALLVSRLRSQGPSAFDPVGDRRRGRAVAATIEASLALLDTVQRDRYMQLAVFREDSEIPRQALELLWGLGDLETDQQCDDFAQMSLVMRYRPGRGSIQLHDVLLAYLRSFLGPDGLRAAHERLLDNASAWLPTTDAPWWDLPITADYLWRMLISHLYQAGRRNDADGLLRNLRWIERKLELYGPTEVELDLAHSDDPVCVSLHQAISQTAHLLGVTDPPSAIADILRTRIEATGQLSPLVATARQGPNRGALSIVWPLPDQPSAMLRRVVSGHAEPLNAALSVQMARGSPCSAATAPYGCATPAPGH